MKNKHGLYVSKPINKQSKTTSTGLSEVPGAYKRVDKKAKSNMETISSRKDVIWSNLIDK